MSNKTDNAAKHTPGPWEASEGDRGSLALNVVKRAPNGSMDLIATTWASVPQGEERKANARLMATAPCLLAACEAVMAAEPGWMAKTHAAIARAKGQ